MALLQPSSRSPGWQARYAREQAAQVVEQVGSVAEDVAAAQDAAATAVAASGTALAASSTATAASGAIDIFQRVRDSFSDDGSVTASDDGSSAKVSIAAHDRHYLDVSDVALSAGVIAGLSFSTEYFIYYLDPALAGGAVTYLAATTIGDAMNTVAVPGRHFVDSVTTPADGEAPTDGGGGFGKPWWRRPNEVSD